MQQKPSPFKRRKSLRGEFDLSVKSDMGQFIIGEELGAGSFGTVHSATHKMTDEKVAIKEVKTEIVSNKNSIEREIKILKELFHPNIIKVYSTIDNKNSVSIIQEFVSGKDLQKFIKHKQKLTEEEACVIFQQVISGVEYLSQMSVAHRDLKPENLLLLNGNEIKIIDFGLGNKFGKNQVLNTQCGSPFYAAPDMLSGLPYNGPSVDVWSCGIILYQMVTGKLPFEDNNVMNLYKKIKAGKYDVPDHVSNNCKNLIKEMLQVYSKNRIKVAQIKNHPWMKLANKDLFYHTGINIKNYLIPIDEDIINLMANYGFKKHEVRKSILMNEHNNITTTYYLFLKRKTRKRIASVADMKSELYVEYLKDENNKLVKYNRSMKEAVEQRASSKGTLTKVIEMEKEDKKMKETIKRRNSLTERRQSITQQRNSLLAKEGENFMKQIQIKSIKEEEKSSGKKTESAQTKKGKPNCTLRSTFSPNLNVAKKSKNVPQTTKNSRTNKIDNFNKFTQTAKEKTKQTEKKNYEGRRRNNNQLSKSARTDEDLTKSKNGKVKEEIKVNGIKKDPDYKKENKNNAKTIGKYKNFWEEEKKEEEKKESISGSSSSSLIITPFRGESEVQVNKNINNFNERINQAKEEENKADDNKANNNDIPKKEEEEGFKLSNLLQEEDKKNDLEIKEIKIDNPNTKEENPTNNIKEEDKIEVKSVDQAEVNSSKDTPNLKSKTINQTNKNKIKSTPTPKKDAKMVSKIGKPKISKNIKQPNNLSLKSQKKDSNKKVSSTSKEDSKDTTPQETKVYSIKNHIKAFKKGNESKDVSLEVKDLSVSRIRDQKKTKKEKPKEKDLTPKIEKKTHKKETSLADLERKYLPSIKVNKGKQRPSSVVPQRKKINVVGHVRKPLKPKADKYLEEKKNGEVISN
ncbi:MAG: protein kinase [archaeon]|nr:protein kinase [archaeon]